MRRRNKKVIIILMLTIIIIGFSKFSLGQKALASPSDEVVNVEVEYGYDSYANFGRYMPITAKINSNENFTGWLEASIPIIEERKVYRKEVNITAGQTKDVSMLVPLTGGFANIEVKLIDDKKDIIYESTKQIQIGNYEKILFAGVLTDDLLELSYLDNLAIKTFPLDENTFPSDNLYLDNLDILIINDFDTSLLDEEQIKAMQQWISKGGTLAIGSGEGALKTVKPIADEFGIGLIGAETFDESKFQLSSVSMDSYVDEDSIEELKHRVLLFEEERTMLRNEIIDQNKQFIMDGNPTIPISSINEEDWPSKAVEGYKLPNITKDFANLYFVEKNIKEDLHYQRKELGKGNILLFNFDLAGQPATTEDSQQTTYEHFLIATIIGNLSESKRAQIDYGMDISGMYLPITNSMSYTDTENIPRVGKYIIILLIYVIVVGPITYIILDKKDKIGLIWIVVPITAVIFTFVVYIAGSNTRVDEPFVGYLEMRTFRDDNIVEDELYFSMTAPYNDNYTLKVSPRYKITELISRDSEFRSYGLNQLKTNVKKYQASINYASNNTIIEINNNPAFNPVFFQYRDEYIGKNPIEADIRYTGDKIEGTITNTSNNTLSNAMYIGDAFIFNIGMINAGQTVDISDLEMIYVHDVSDIYESGIIDYIVREESKSTEVDVYDPQFNTDMVDANRKREILYYFVDSQITYAPDENCIIGFADDVNTNTLIKEISNDLDVYGTKAISSKVDVDYSQGDRVFVPSISSLVSKEKMGIFGPKGSKYDSNHYPTSIAEEETIMEYYLPEDEKVLSIEYYALSNQDAKMDYHKTFSGRIYALNRKTGEFDHIFTVNDSKNEDETLMDSKTLGKYLTKDNELTFKYETSLSQMDREILFPNISYWKGGE